MKRTRPIDFSGRRYRRLFREIKRQSSIDGWQRIEQGNLLCWNWRFSLRVPTNLPAGVPVHCYGVESDEDITLLLESNSHQHAPDIVFIAGLHRDNLYGFGTATLERTTVLFRLDFVPESVEERHHAFSLFHKALVLRQIGAILCYYDRVLKMLTMTGPLPACPPDLLEALGRRSLPLQLRIMGERAATKFDLWNRWSRLRATLHAAAGRPSPKPLKDCRHALITGWYGTETAGDKAILMELVHVLRENAPGIAISITSIVPGWSYLTNLELGLDARVLELRHLKYRTLGSVDLVVFGGGPLMDSSQLRYIETLFTWARARGVATLVFGCGVGPLRTDIGVERVKSILRNTDHAFFRDEHSACLAQDLGFRGPRLHACDPAMRYVVRWREERTLVPANPRGDRLVTLLRAQTSEYSATAEAESDRLRQEMVRFFRRFLNEDAERDVSMLPMHTFWLGNDDRQFNRCVVVALGGEERLRSCYQPLTLDGLLKRISTAAWGVPMRFHGHVFLLALNIPFLSINYTGDGGKVSQLIDRYALADWSLSLQECFEEGAIWRRWERLLTRNEDRRARIRAQLDEDLRSLERIYELLWGERKASGSG